MRTKGSNGARLDKHENEINQLKQEAIEVNRKYEEHLEMHIKEDLQAERFPGSNKPLYTYDDIAQKHNVKKNRVQKIAEENNLTRRKGKNIG